MPTNTYFKYGVKSEQDLYEDLVIESLKIYGQDLYYLPRNIVEEDDILNEEILSRFDESYMIEMYLENLEGFEGEDILAKFGLTVTDECTLIVSRRRWEELVQRQNNDINQDRPYEGDLIYIPYSKTLFEIRFVEDQVPFFQLNRLPVYSMRCELFQYENQELDTGIDEIDDLAQVYSGVTNVIVTTTTGQFEVGEDLVITTPDSNTIEAKCVNIQTTDSGRMFSLTNITYPSGEPIEIQSGFTITGTKSEAAGVIGNIIGLNDPDFEENNNDKYADNDKFENSGFDFIDFSENNPFGDL